MRSTAQQPKLFVGMVLILIFSEVLGLYGLIVAIILHIKVQYKYKLVCQKIFGF